MANFQTQAVDAVTFHINTVRLHGEVRKAEVVDVGFDRKNEKGEVVEHVPKNVIVIKIDDDNCDRIELVDPDPANIDRYQRGDIGDFTMRLDITKEFGSKYTARLYVIDFVPDKKK